MRTLISQWTSWIIDAAEESGRPFAWLTAATACVVFLLGIGVILAFT